MLFVSLRYIIRNEYQNKSVDIFRFFLVYELFAKLAKTDAEMEWKEKQPNRTFEDNINNIGYIPNEIISKKQNVKSDL